MAKKKVGSIEMSIRLNLLLRDRDKHISLFRRARALGVHRSLFYRKRSVPKACKEDGIAKEIRRIYEERPFYGYRKIRIKLKEQNLRVNGKKIQKIKKALNLLTIYPRKKTSIPGAGHVKSEYKLRNVEITRINQVWSTDITYIRTEKGYMYLIAIIDVYSRCVIGSRLSNTMGVEECIDVLEEGLKKGMPEILNTDQGSQFTSERYRNKLKELGIELSQTGKGRCLDNVWIERLWRTYKYEELYLRGERKVKNIRANLRSYIEFYNKERPHEGIGYRKPEELYMRESNI